MPTLSCCKDIHVHAFGVPVTESFLNFSPRDWVEPGPYGHNQCKTGNREAANQGNLIARGYY
jgi:hypothetical protein